MKTGYYKNKDGHLLRIVAHDKYKKCFYGYDEIGFVSLADNYFKDLIKISKKEEALLKLRK